MNPPLTSDPRRVPASNGFAWLAQSLSLVRHPMLCGALLMQLALGLAQPPLVAC
jgi:protein-S-isoprenylcysteine O-methyltransferase Ste14